MNLKQNILLIVISFVSLITIFAFAWTIPRDVGKVVAPKSRNVHKTQYDASRNN